MVQPMGLFEQLKQTYFKQTKTLALYFSTVKFDKVMKKKEDGSFSPVFNDLPSAKQDCIDLESCLRKFQIDDEADIYRLEDPTMQQLWATMANITKRIKQAPNERFFVIMLFAGHGIMKQGIQNLVVNEYSKSDGFYKMYGAEGSVRMMSNKLPNAYFMCIFACCRQTYDWDKMKGFYDADQLNLEQQDKWENLEQSEINVEQAESESRGLGIGSEGVFKHQKNFVFIWGCRPQAGVAANTQMVPDICKVLIDKRNRDTMTIELPKALDHLKGKDANFEMVTSNTVQPILIPFKNNTVTDTIAYIFVNSECKDLIYKRCVDKAKRTLDLYKNVLQFDRVEVFNDLSKEEIIKKLDILKRAALDFEGENRHKPNSNLAIAIAWIGFKLQSSWYTPHKLILQQLKEGIEDLSQSQLKQSLMKKTSEALKFRLQRSNSITDYTSRVRTSIKGITQYIPEYAMTVKGELICMNEYAAEIVDLTEKTCVLLTEDYSSWSGTQLTKEHINLDAGLDEKILPKRSGRTRLTYGFNTKCIYMHDYFKNCRQLHDRHVFCFPHHLRKAGSDIYNFEEVTHGEESLSEFVLDLRTPEQLKACGIGKKTITFKPFLDIWNERPQLVHDEMSTFVKFKSQLDYLPTLRVAVRIKATQEKFVDFDFCEGFGKFRIFQTLQIKRDHHNLGTLAKDLKKDSRGNQASVIAVIYSSQKHLMPMKLVKFQCKQVEGSKDMLFEEVEAKAFCSEQIDVLYNIFEMSKSQVMAALAHSLKIISSDNFDELVNIDYTDLGYNIKEVSCLNESFDCRTRFITSFYLNAGQPKFHPKSRFVGFNRRGCKSLIVVCRLEEELLAEDFKVEDVQDASILLNDENVAQVLEYSQGKMIAHLSTREILIINDWKVMKKLTEPNDGNTSKFWMARLPGFSETDFPFIVCSGWETFNLINVKDYLMEPLIKAPVRINPGQSAAFIHEEIYGFSIHFATQRVTSEGTNIHHWHSMAFRQDFIQTLRKYGRLPYCSYSEQLEEVRLLKQRISDMEAENSSVQGLKAKISQLKEEERRELLEQLATPLMVGTPKERGEQDRDLMFENPQGQGCSSCAIF